MAPQFLHLLWFVIDYFLEIMSASITCISPLWSASRWHWKMLSHWQDLNSCHPFTFQALAGNTKMNKLPLHWAFALCAAQISSLSTHVSWFDQRVSGLSAWVVSGTCPANSDGLASLPGGNLLLYKYPANGSGQLSYLHWLLVSSEKSSV